MGASGAKSDLRGRRDGCPNFQWYLPSSCLFCSGLALVRFCSYACIVRKEVEIDNIPHTKILPPAMLHWKGERGKVREHGRWVVVGVYNRIRIIRTDKVERQNGPVLIKNGGDRDIASGACSPFLSKILSSMPPHLCAL